MKVDWSKAPEWANYHAIDSDGRAFFYEENPEIFNSSKCWNSNLRLTRDDDGKRWDVDNWKKSLTKRPKEVEDMESDKITIEFDQKQIEIEKQIKELFKAVIELGKDYEKHNIIINELKENSGFNDGYIKELEGKVDAYKHIIQILAGR